MVPGVVAGVLVVSAEAHSACYYGAQQAAAERAARHGALPSVVQDRAGSG